MAVTTEKEIAQFKSRLKELARRSYEQNMFTFTPMLGLMEQTVFGEMEEELRYAGYTIFGGHDHAERVMIRFGKAEEFGYEEDFPIVLIHMKPLLQKFSDEFSHRDFLGALMNLGISRDLLGDILVGDRQGFLFCQASIAEFICAELTQVKHTHISCSIASELSEYEERPPVEEEHLVASERLDGLVSQIYHLSRSQSLTLFRDKRVFVNGRLTENNSRSCKPGEVVNVRGFGKFIYDGIGYTTKKGKQRVKIRIYR